MKTAKYKLTIGPLIDTIFAFKIGNRIVNTAKLEGSLKNIDLYGEGLEIVLELGGIMGQKYCLEVTLEENDKAWKTCPEQIEGEIEKGGGIWLKEIYPIVEK